MEVEKGRLGQSRLAFQLVLLIRSGNKVAATVEATPMKIDLRAIINSG